MREWWPQGNHPVWQSKIFVRYSWETLMELRNHVVTGKFVDNTSQMTATGIPNVIILHARLDALEGKFGYLQGQFEALDTHTGARFDELALRLNSLPQDITDKLTENFTIEGQQVGRVDFMKFREEVLSLMRDFQDSTERSVRVRSDENSVIPRNDGNTQSTMQLYHYDGSFHMLPKDFEFPKCTAQNMWTMWHIGIASFQIGPLMAPCNLPKRVCNARSRFLATHPD